MLTALHIYTSTTTDYMNISPHIKYPPPPQHTQQCRVEQVLSFYSLCNIINPHTIPNLHFFTVLGLNVYLILWTFFYVNTIWLAKCDSHPMLLANNLCDTPNNPPSIPPQIYPLSNPLFKTISRTVMPSSSIPIAYFFRRTWSPIPSLQPVTKVRHRLTPLYSLSLM